MVGAQEKLELWGGIECTINRVGDQYFDQLEFANHYHRAGDIGRIAALGITTLRYPLLWERHQPAADRPIDWNQTTQKLEEIRSSGIKVIAGLVHHGSGPIFVRMLEDSFAEGLARYAGLVAAQFPWIDHYTPVNEPLTTARFCGLYGIWHPHEKSPASFCRIVINECKATVLSMQAIRCINPMAKLVQTEDLGKTHSTPLLKYQADFENHRRWLTFDLLCGRVNDKHPLWDYLLLSGIKPDELIFFQENKCPPDIMGINHYLTSERYLDENTRAYPKHVHGGNGIHQYADIEAVRVGAICPDGPFKLLRETWKRYHKPIAVTETHLHCTREEQMRWLSLAWHNALKLIREGVNIHAITTWAMLGSFGWSELLTKHPGRYEPGAFDLSDGNLRPTVIAKMIRSYTKTGNFIHPVLSNDGWWQRECRAIYGINNIYPAEQKEKEGRPVLIIGSANAPVVEACVAVCTLRGINYICFDHTQKEYLLLLETVISSLLPWLIIDTYPLEHLRRSKPSITKQQVQKTLSQESFYKLCLEYKARLLTFYCADRNDQISGSSNDTETEQLVKWSMISRENVYAQKCDSLTIRLTDAVISELPEIYNCSLDLLLDGENGDWDLSFSEHRINRPSHNPGQRGETSEQLPVPAAMTDHQAILQEDLITEYFLQTP